MNVRCAICGRFVGADDEIESRRVWACGPVPEPSHDEYWHKECPRDVEKEKKNVVRR